MSLNPWFNQKLKGVHSPETVKVIIESHPGKSPQVLEGLRRVSGVQVNTSQMSFDRFIPATVPLSAVEQLKNIEGVKMVHYDQPVRVKDTFTSRSPNSFVASLEKTFLTKVDPLMGQVSISAVEVPGIPVSAIALAPFNFFGNITGLPSPEGPGGNVKIIPVSTVLDDIKIPIGLTLNNPVAVIDTGPPAPWHPLMPATRHFVNPISLVPLELPVDMMGHGTWCATTAFGDSFNTNLGLCRGVASAKNFIGIKALSNLGFGDTSAIIKAMEMAHSMGAQVVSMSLGADLQGTVEQDPICQAVEILKDDVIFCIAAGNDGKDWSIGSPGASPHAITVGARAYPTSEGQASYFSSRGPQGIYYQENPDLYNQDLQKYGDDLVKPDVSSPGGGTPSSTITPDVVLYSGCCPWFAGYYSGVPGLFEAMEGTSMATPIVAGIVSLFKEAGRIRTAADFKVIARTALLPMQIDRTKTFDQGYGLVNLEQLLAV